MVLLIDRKRSIGQAAREIGVQESVIRFWETQFVDYVKPTIGNGNRRYFYDKDIKILKLIKQYLYDKGFTIKGLQKLLETENLDIIAESNNKVNIESNNKIENSKTTTVNVNDFYLKSNEINKINKNVTAYNDHKKNSFFEDNTENKYRNNDFIEKNNSNLKNNLKALKTKLNIFYEKLKSI